MDTFGSLRTLKRTGGASNIVEPSSPGPHKKKEPELFINMFNISHADSLKLDGSTKEAYLLLKQATKLYHLVLDSTSDKV